MLTIGDARVYGDGGKPNVLDERRARQRNGWIRGVGGGEHVTEL